MLYRMITAARLGGFFAAHAIWSVSTGETLVPMLAYTTEHGEQRMERHVGQELGASVEAARARLRANAMDANDAALLFDGRITLGAAKLDAIVIEHRAFFSPRSEMILAVPYTPATSGRFRVHRPKLMLWQGCEDFDQSAVLNAFFEGVDSHAEGVKVWNAALDESK